MRRDRRPGIDGAAGLASATCLFPHSGCSTESKGQSNYQHLLVDFALEKCQANDNAELKGLWRPLLMPCYRAADPDAKGCRYSCSPLELHLSLNEYSREAQILISRHMTEMHPGTYTVPICSSFRLLHFVDREIKK